MKPNNQRHLTSALLVAVFLVISAIMANCKGKHEKTSGTDLPAGTPVPAPAMSDQPAAASAPAAQPQIPTADQQAMNDAALNGELEHIREMISRGADPNGIDQEGRTALMFASFNGHTEIVRLLLESGARVGTRDVMGRTALLYGSTGPFTETVKLLLDHHADPNIVDNDEHFSPLMHAAAEGQLEVVRILLENGADPTLKDIDGDTAALFARNNGHMEVAGLIQSFIDAR
jgi:ankyrin repeat protein